MWSLVLTSWVLHAVTLYMQLASRVLSTKHIIASLAKACSCSFTAANHTLAQRVISMASLASSGGQARRTESDDWGTVLGATSAVPISTPAHETSMPSPAAHPHCTAAEALAWESALSATELGSCSSSTLYASTQVHTSTAAGTFQHSEASAPALLTAETATEVPQPSPSAEMHTLAPIACLPAPRPLFVVVECGSHSIRAVLHDGTRELERMLFDTLLAQALQPDGHFNPDGLQQTYDALDNIAARIQEYLVAGYVLMGKRQIATGAVRGCKRGSRDTFSCTARSIIGTPVNVLTGEEEARLNFLGVTSSQASTTARSTSTASSSQPAQRVLVVDLGGRTTELAFGTSHGHLEHVTSVPLGCVDLSLWLSQQPQKNQQQATGSTLSPQAAADNLQDERRAATSKSGSASASAGQQDVLRCSQHAVEVVRDHAWQQAQWLLALMPLEAGSAVTTSAGRTAPSGLLQPTHIETEDEPSSIVVVVTGGTATTVAALALQLDAYTREGVHGSMLTLTQLLDLAQMLREEGGHARLLQMHPALLTQERAQTLLGGVCGLLGLAQCFGLWSGSVEKQAGDIVLAGRDSGDGGGSEEKVVGIVHGGVMHVHGFAVSDFDLLDGALAELLAEHNALPDDDWEGDV